MSALYAIITRDAPGKNDSRLQHRDGHLSHFRAHKAQIAMSGPMSHDSGESAGSLVVYEAASEAEALRFIQGDPFYENGVWAEVTVAQFKPSIFTAAKFQA